MNEREPPIALSFPASLSLTFLSEPVFPFKSLFCSPRDWGYQSKQDNTETQRDPAKPTLVQEPLHVPCFLSVGKSL